MISFKDKIKGRIKICLRYICEYIHFPSKNKSIDTFYFVIDPKLKHPGFADRIKAIVNCYFIALQNGFDFKLYFKHPFVLEKYLKPNDVDWLCSLDDMNKSVVKGNLIIYTGSMPVPKLHRNRQYHCYNYYGYDLLSSYYKDKNKWRSEFKRLYDQLFTPSPIILNLLQNVNLKERSYVAVHFRFVNALGDSFEKWSRSKILSEDERDLLISRCLGALKRKKRHMQIRRFTFSRIVSAF